MIKKSILDRILNSSSFNRRVLLICLDWTLLMVALWAAIAIRLEMTWPPLFDRYWWLFPTVPLLSLPFFLSLGLYRTIVRYSSLHTLWHVFKATGTATLVLIVLVSFMRWTNFPRSGPILFFIFSFLFLSGYRFLIKQLFTSIRAETHPDAKKVIIYGAGSSGAQISSAFKMSDEFKPVAFVDDDPKLQGRELNGLKIYPPKKIADLVRRYSPEFVLLAMPSAGRKRIRKILDQLEPLKVNVKRLPYLDQMVSNELDISHIQNIALEDLLGRDPIPPRPDLLRACITNKNVMVTGAGGSIGSELSRQVIELNPKRLILFEHSEFALYKIEAELRTKFNSKIELLPILGSVRDFERIKKVISVFHIDTVYHAAAYKHVPLVEFNPIEGIQNNLFGTVNTALAALEYGVETFILISTDKAVRPTNIMGATKRLAEKFLQALSSTKNQTVFTMVRFGNVLGSSGSVVPLFRKQIRNGGPVTVTHPEIVRYFMTIPEAVGLVIQAGSMAKGGEVFVLDMGKPVKIIDLAKKMIQLSGLTIRDENNPEGEIDIVFTGLRPGEKLFEELLTGSNVVGTEHPMIMMAKEKFCPLPTIQEVLKNLEMACSEFDLEKIRQILQETVEGYNPQCESIDPVWLARSKSEKTTNTIVKKISAGSARTSLNM